MNEATIELVLGDITRMQTDAIVNAANTSLLGGGGVDGAIHRAAGPELLEACRRLGGCATGEARITPGFNLPARFVIHTPGPVWSGGHHNEERLLANCYLNSLKIASENQLGTIAFPGISTGVYGYPGHLAAEIAIAAVRQFLLKPSSIKTVYFVVFDEANLLLYQNLLA